MKHVFGKNVKVPTIKFSTFAIKSLQNSMFNVNGKLNLMKIDYNFDW